MRKRSMVVVESKAERVECALTHLDFNHQVARKSAVSILQCTVRYLCLFFPDYFRMAR